MMAVIMSILTGLGKFISVLAPLLVQLATWLGLGWIFAKSIESAIWTALVILASCVGFGVILLCAMKGISMLRGSGKGVEKETVVYVGGLGDEELRRLVGGVEGVRVGGEGGRVVTVEGRRGGGGAGGGR